MSVIGLEEWNQAPDLVGKVVGIRQWNWNPVVRALSSRTGYTWVPGPNRALCGSNHTPPDANCGCGLYAYHDPRYIQLNGAYGPITGVIQGWGKMSVAKHGFRAEYAEIIGMVDEGSFAVTAQVRSIAKEYNVPLITRDDLPEFIKINGGPVPKELLPGVKPKKAKPKLPGGNLVTVTSVEQESRHWPWLILPAWFFCSLAFFAVGQPIPPILALIIIAAAVLRWA